MFSNPTIDKHHISHISLSIKSNSHHSTKIVLFGLSCLVDVHLLILKLISSFNQETVYYHNQKELPVGIVIDGLLVLLFILPLKRMDLAIWPTGTPIFFAASSAVGVEPGSYSRASSLWWERNSETLLGILLILLCICRRIV